MQGGGAKHSLSYWNTDDNDDEDKYDEDDNNDDDDNADGDYTQNSRKCSFSLRYLEQNLFAKATWMRLYISHSILCFPARAPRDSAWRGVGVPAWRMRREQIFIENSLKAKKTIKTHAK